MLVSDARYLQPMGINAYEDTGDQPDINEGISEHQAAIEAYRQAGILIEQVQSPENCQDGVFTANWGLAWNGRVLLSKLPNLRRAEEAYAEQKLRNLGFETRRASVLFSGQGDALIIGGNRVIIGDGYRTDARVADEISDWLGLEVIVARTKPKRSFPFGPPVKNRVTGLWDSYFYDLDLAVGVVRPNLIAVCFDALTGKGEAAIRKLKDIDIVPVSEYEAKQQLACNFVSNGETVVVSDGAKQLAKDLRSKGLNVVSLPNRQLRKSGGGFRCISLSLYI